MFSSKKTSIVTTLIIVAVIVINLFVPTVHAQAYRGLIINEYKFDYPEPYAPGSQIQDSFTVKHDFQDKEKDVTLYLKGADFTSDGVSGTPKFLAPNSLAKEASLASWIEFEKDVIHLNEFGAEETINFTINVPANAEPGGKYAAILMSDKEGGSAINPDNNDNELGLSKELGPLVIMKVDGETTESISSDALYTVNIKGKETKFFFNPPVNIVSKLANDGNIHTIPRGAIYVYKGDNFNEYDQKFELNEDESYVLPNSTREFRKNWNESFIKTEMVKNEDGTSEYKTTYDWDNLSKFRLGKYNVKVMYLDNGSGSTYDAHTSFYVFPWQLLVLIIVIILFILTIILVKIAKSKNSDKKGSKSKTKKPRTPQKK